MGASVPNRFMTEPLEFVPQMQHAALEINYHQVIRRRVSQSVSDLLFEGFVPPFKISNMARFRHDSLRIHASDFSEEKNGHHGTSGFIKTEIVDPRNTACLRNCRSVSVTKASTTLIYGFTCSRPLSPDQVRERSRHIARLVS